MKTLRTISVVVLGLMSACHGPLIGVNVEVVDEKTLLERQILGSYEELSKDLVMLASVRGVDETGKTRPIPYLPPNKEKALRAAQSREFNRDDVDTFKKDRCAGEGADGTLHIVSCAKANQQKNYAHLRLQVVKEENEDRRIILSRVIETSENMSPKDLPKLQKVFAQMNRDNVKSGELYQSEAGQWVRKP